MGTFRWLVGVALVALLPVAGCTSKPASKPTPTPNVSLHTPSPPSSSDARAEVQAAVAAYMNLLYAFVAASNAGTDDTTEVAKHATGSALQVLTNGLADNKAKGLHTQGTPGIDQPQVTGIAPVSSPTSVAVTGCVDGTNWLLYNSSGQIVDSGPSGRRGTSAKIEKRDGAWKVTSLAIRGVGTCPG